MRALKACGDCGNPSPKSTCPDCRKKKDRARSAQYRADVDVPRLEKLKARAKKRQPWCAWPGCTLPITPTNPITVDHARPIDVAPQLCYSEENLICVCRHHNSVKGTKSLLGNGRLVQEEPSPFTPRDVTPPVDKTLYL